MNTKVVITWQEIYRRVSLLTDKSKKYWGIPRGGQIIAGLTGNAVDSIDECDIIIDDIYESGNTARAYEKHGKEMVFLFDKRKEFRDIWLVLPWENENEENDLENNFLRILQFHNNDPEKAKSYLLGRLNKTEDTIWASVRLEFEQFHRWSNAPEKVAHLRNLHRHKFHLQVDIQQFYDDRDVEYLMFAKEVKQMGKQYEWNENTSCEMYSIFLKRLISEKYPHRKIKVSLYEDGENGCVIE